MLLINELIDCHNAAFIFNFDVYKTPAEVSAIYDYVNIF